MRTMKRLTLALVLVMALGLLLPAGSPGGPALAGATAPLRMYNVWATWCSPCVAEIPALGRIARNYAGRVEVIGLQYDALYYNGEENPEAIQKGKELFASSNATYTNLVPDSSHSTLLDGAEYFPTTYFMNRQGEIIKKVVGGYDYNGWVRVINKLLAGLPKTYPGDANNDGNLDIRDLVTIIEYLVHGTEPEDKVNADANGDNTVDIRDLVWIIERIVVA